VSETYEKRILVKAAHLLLPTKSGPESQGRARPDSVHLLFLPLLGFTDVSETSESDRVAGAYHLVPTMVHSPGPVQTKLGET